MRYDTVIPAVFLSRPNRFVAEVLLDGKAETVHVKNTGRCRELLLPGATVYLSAGNNPARRTRYDLVAVEKVRPGKAPLLINLDAQAPNEAAAEWLSSGGFLPGALVRREVRYGASRFDFLLEREGRRTYLEVKGVTLEEGGVCRFPDAPTERGVRHLRELIAAREAGEGAAILFVIQMKEMHLFRPNTDTHPAFAEALRDAKAAGVTILARDCIVTPEGMWIDREVEVELG
ncbi:MAG: DNA/RNA nuclease SfsA [Ruminococcaceae bacterium]|nr:DNA/RNA nuclease SfsA [Oscillospiraceae bacterium]